MSGHIVEACLQLRIVQGYMYHRYCGTTYQKPHTSLCGQNNMQFQSNAAISLVN